MSQYFDNDTTVRDKAIPIHFTVHQTAYTLQSDTGVFSKDKLDMGTRILLETVLQYEKNPLETLDLGCGIGSVGVVLSHEWDTHITMVDINKKAIALARHNMSDPSATIVCQDGIQEGDFDCIVFNPPIRAGKKVMYRLFDECIHHCKGRIWIVIRKQHGAQSAVNYFEKQGCIVERVHREKGYWVLKIEKEQ